MADELKFERLNYEHTFARFAIPAVTASTKQAIKRKTAFNLPDRPSDMGMKPSEIKAAFWSPVIDDDNSAVAEIDRVIEDVNKLILELCKYVEARSFVSADYIEDERVVRFTFGDNTPLDIDVAEIFLTPVVDGEGEYAGAQEGGGGRALGMLSMALGKDTYAGSYAFPLCGFDAALGRYYVVGEGAGERSTEGEIAKLSELIGGGTQVYYSVRMDFIRTMVSPITGAGKDSAGRFYIQVETLFNSGKGIDPARDYVTVVGHPEIGTSVIGAYAQASGEGSVAMAAYADAGGEGCIADKFGFTRGKYNTVGYAAGSVGYMNKILGLKSFGYGDGNEVAYNASESLVGGFRNRVLHKRSVAIGEGLTTTMDHGAWFGKYNDDFTAGETIFGVAYGTAEKPDNKFLIYKSGNAWFDGTVGGSDPFDGDDFVTKSYADKMYDETFNITSLDTVYKSVSSLPYYNVGNGTQYVVQNGANLSIYTYDSENTKWNYVATCEANKLYTVLEGSKRGIYRYTMSEPYLVPAAVPVLKSGWTTAIYALKNNVPTLVEARLDPRTGAMPIRATNGWLRVNTYEEVKNDEAYKGYNSLDEAEKADVKRHVALSAFMADGLYDKLGAAAKVKEDLLNGAGAAFDTLQELAAALGNDPNFATTMSEALAGKVDIIDKPIGDGTYVYHVDANGEITLRGTSSIGSKNLIAKFSDAGRLAYGDLNTNTKFEGYGEMELPHKKAIADYFSNSVGEAVVDALTDAESDANEALKLQAEGVVTAKMGNYLLKSEHTTYTHPTDAGYLHIPSGGSSGQVLIYGGSSGTARWGAVPAATSTTFGGIKAAYSKGTLTISLS